jgi:hypothetical protein
VYVVLGSPSLQSQAYASALRARRTRELQGRAWSSRPDAAFFHNVFVFSMNDEVVHTGYSRWRTTCWHSGCTPGADKAEGMESLDDPKGRRCDRRL